MEEPENDKLRLRLVLRESDAAAIYRHAQRVSQPNSATYGQYVTRAQIAAWGNPTSEQRQRVLSLFSGLELHELGASPLIIVSGTRVELAPFFQPQVLDRVNAGSAAGLQLHPWDYSDALSEVASAIRSLHVSAATPPTTPEAAATGSHEEPSVTSCTSRVRAAPGEEPKLEHGATPDMIRQLYNFPPDLLGQGQTIAILSIGGADLETRQRLERDLQEFWAEFGVQRAPVIFQPVGPEPAASMRHPLYQLEATMGPAWIGALAPRATVVLYELALDLLDPWLAAVEMAVADEVNQPTILCFTWTMPEEFYYQRFDRESIALALAKASALGITVIAASGDWGVYDGRPGANWGGNSPSENVARAAWPHATFPSSEDRVLSVGGTMVSSLRPEDEVGWSGPLPPDPALARELPFTTLATSGGFSHHVPVPDWQREAVVGRRAQKSYSRGSALPAVLPYGRGFPDVALMAAGPSLPHPERSGISSSGYLLVAGGRWISYAGGTSMAAPIWACALAACNERREIAGKPRVGFVNAALYYLGSTRPTSGRNAVLRQIKNGSSDIEFRVVTGHGLTDHHVLAGYQAQSQWDPVTGLGVPNVANLAKALLQYPG